MKLVKFLDYYTRDAIWVNPDLVKFVRANATGSTLYLIGDTNLEISGTLEDVTKALCGE